MQITFENMINTCFGMELLEWLLVFVRWCDIIIQTYALVYWFKAHFRGAIFVIG